MIFVHLLAAYILIGLLVACAMTLYAMCPRSGTIEVEEVLGSGLLWPVIIIALLIDFYRWGKRKGTDWVMRLRDTYGQRYFYA